MIFELLCCSKLVYGTKSIPVGPSPFALVLFMLLTISTENSDLYSLVHKNLGLPHHIVLCINFGRLRSVQRLCQVRCTD